MQMNRDVKLFVTNENMLLSLRGLANNNNSANDAHGVPTRAEAMDRKTSTTNPMVSLTFVIEKI